MASNGNQYLGNTYLVGMPAAEACAVYLENTKITSNLHDNLRDRWHEEELKQYLAKRHQLSTETFETIHWQSLQFALEKFNAHRRALAVKALHRHLPTHDKLFKQGRVVMSSICPCCVQQEETNAHVLCCPNAEAVQHRKAAWVDLWKVLHKSRMAAIVELIWQLHLHPLLGIPLGTIVIDSIPAAHAETADILNLAVEEQTQIGWEKLLFGVGSSHWKTLQDYIDMGNPKAPQRTALAWMNSAMYHLLHFSIRCWKQRNLMVHGSTKKEQNRIALQKAQEQIKQVYANPPELAPHFASIFAVPLERRLKLPLQYAEHWLAMIRHQAKVTAHNLKVLLNQHRSMESHLRTMRREARSQAKERAQPETPRKAHRRAVQAANKAMRERLYSAKTGS